MENPYQIVTDSSSDLPLEFLVKEDILSMPLSFVMDGKKYYSGEMDVKEFYQRMRVGAMPVTSQVNVDEAKTAFESVLQKGKDILYIAFSSKMSGTCNSAKIAAEELGPLYPQQKIVIVDSLSISLGEGLLVYLANQLKQKGANLEHAAQWVRDHVLKLAHFVTANDLTHLHRGGRISKTSTILGSMLGIQPIIHISNQGEAKMIGTKRGRKNALDSLVDHMAKVMGDVVNSSCFIAHADCEQDALYVKDKVQQVFGIKQFVINFAGPVMGAHTGPGAVGLFLLADHR